MNSVSYCKNIFQRLKQLSTIKIYIGNSTNYNEDCLILMPVSTATLYCGLAGLVSYRKASTDKPEDVYASIDKLLNDTKAMTFARCSTTDFENYLGGKNHLKAFKSVTRKLNDDNQFYKILKNTDILKQLSAVAAELATIIDEEKEALQSHSGSLSPSDVDIISGNIESVMDIQWCISKEISENILSVEDLISNGTTSPTVQNVEIFKKLNTVLNSIDRLEVRGRDSAGISVLFTLTKPDFEIFRKNLIKATFYDQLKGRTNKDILLNNGITIHDSTIDEGEDIVTISFVYKIAAEIGSLGDNVSFLRHRIKTDQLLQTIVHENIHSYSVSAHTRWASVGAISEENCHPVDNETADREFDKSGIIHVCLNGDIDNHLTLKEQFENRWSPLPDAVTTDTKIIPMQIEKYLKDGDTIDQAFRMAVNDFEGSHAISMQTDLAPGKLFLAQKGSGQAVFIGIANDHLMAVSEVYGFVEETPWYIKLDGEKIVPGINGNTQGQIFILDNDKKPNVSSKLDGIEAMYYDGSKIELSDEDIRYTDITSRDIDRQDFSHYFLKEITESPVSVEKTLQNKWKVKDQQYVTELDSSVVPPTIIKALEQNQIKRIFFIGQGTAGVAALACSSIMSHYINDSSIYVSALKASEFSGFMIKETDDENSLADTLVIAISQSGTTTDTNLCVDMVREHGAHTLAIVNRRDSDLTFKADGTLYTSSGRDLEMSVASTKAFYSQIVAGSILSLHIASVSGKRSPDFVTGEIKQLLVLPEIMKRVLLLKDQIKASAKTYATEKTYWAAVGSGSNKASSDEIRIKLSELCYKTISSDFVEDKKHIDLSAEPLIIVCAAGTRESVLGDIIKDTAIFHAHKAIPIVIANEGEERFTPYAKSVFHVPSVSEHFAPIVNTLVGHIWGYYAALAINAGSEFIFNNREDIQTMIDDYALQGLNVYEVFLENSFREKITAFYTEFRQKRRNNELPVIIGLNTASDLTLLLKYLSGKLPVSDFEIDFGIKGTPLNMLNTLFACMNESIGSMSRPIDAIKHQAKTVTVGTSRITEKMEGLLFDILSQNKIGLSQLTSSNILVLKNLQDVIGGSNGLQLYRISNLSMLGKKTSKTAIELVKKEGVFENIPSRVESDNKLRGTKSIIVREGNVFIGWGNKDRKNILTIPVLSSTANVIEFILSVNVFFKDEVPLFKKAKALGGKYERISNIIQEDGLNWESRHLELLQIEELFGLSAEKIGERIIESLNKNNE